MTSPGELCRVVPCHEMAVWGEIPSPPASPVRHGTVIAPPPMFQDSTPLQVIERFATSLVEKLIMEAVDATLKATWSIPCSQVCHKSETSERRPSSTGARWSGLRLCWTPELQPYSPCHARLSSSQTSLSVRGDDSSFVSSALSHDALNEVYSEPFEHGASYAVPVEIVRPVARGPRRSAAEGAARERQPRSSSAGSTSEPIHLTLQEVRQYLNTLYSSGNDATEALDRISRAFSMRETNNNKTLYNKPRMPLPKEMEQKEANAGKKQAPHRMSLPGLKQTLCSMFRFRKILTPAQCLGRREAPAPTDEVGARLSGQNDPPSPITRPPFMRRALPPLPAGDVPPPRPPKPTDRPSDLAIDFAASIQKVKDVRLYFIKVVWCILGTPWRSYVEADLWKCKYGWYWGPITGETAERILSDEPDGSFIVRDSSDDYYIFSLTFKLNSIVRHVRIEHDQGNFSFGNTTRFKSHTIVDFIESAVEHSRSGRYLFFLHRRPVLGPMRVQLLHPVSRFKQVQSLQHMCRFVILKHVRRDLISELPLPKRLLDYLSTPHYYTEHILEDCETTTTLGDPRRS